MLTLTFDNGPHSDVTPLVLRELAARGLPAIFFPLGERLEDPAHRALMHRAAAEGHGVGNHTYSHPRPFGALPADAAINEIIRTDALLEGLHEPERLFRPSAGGGEMRPGVLNQGVADYLVTSRHTLVLWNVICEDWARPDGSWIDLALERMQLQPWSLLVLHDVATGAMDHLGAFLDRVLEAGIAVTADIPPETMPIRRGELVLPVDFLIAD